MVMSGVRGKCGQSNSETLTEGGCLGGEVVKEPAVGKTRRREFQTEGKANAKALGCECVRCI